MLRVVARAWARGWFLVEGDPTQERFWDGVQWTGEVRPIKKFLGFSTSGNDPRKIATAAQTYGQAIQSLQAAAMGRRRGDALVAWRSAASWADEAYGPDGVGKLGAALDAMAFDRGLATSPAITVIPTLGGAPVEIFNDFIVYGNQAFDSAQHSRLEVFTDGQIQVTMVNVVKNGKVKAVKQTHDLRTADIQYTSPTGSLRARFHPDLANDVRRFAAQYNSYVETLKPAAVSGADIKAMLDTIMNANGQPPAERIQELDKLRYQRLLTDEEFKQASAKILGIA
jgi:hypothetical protein